MLHPAVKFKKPDRSRSADQRVSKCKRKDIFSNTRVPVATGIVDLCPCIKLRHTDLLSVFGLSVKGTDLPRAIDKHIIGSKLVHTCEHQYGTSASLKNDIEAIFSGDTPQIKIKYTYTSDETSDAHPPRMLCPHLKLDTYVRSLITAGVRQPGPHAWNQRIDQRTMCMSTRTDQHIMTHSAQHMIATFTAVRTMNRFFWDAQRFFPLTKNKQAVKLEVLKRRRQQV